MRRNEPDHGGEKRRVIGEAEARDQIRHDVQRQDEIGKCCEQHAADPHRGRRIERAIIGGDKILDEGHAPGETLQLRPKIAANLVLTLHEDVEREFLAKRCAPQIDGIICDHGDHLVTQFLQ